MLESMSSTKLKKFNHYITPQLFDNDLIKFDTLLSKQLGQKYIIRIAKRFSTLLSRLHRSGVVDQYAVRVHEKKIHISYEAEGDLIADLNSRTIRLSLMF